MSTLLALFRLFTTAAPARRRDPVQQLMERAGRRKDPREAQQLRAAASAWLRVIR
jgi:hypothetical protein